MVNTAMTFPSTEMKSLSICMGRAIFYFKMRGQRKTDGERKQKKSRNVPCWDMAGVSSYQ